MYDTSEVFEIIDLIVLDVARRMDPSDIDNTTATKQYATRQKIEQYFHRLTEGCGGRDCTNPNCASNPSQKVLPVNQAAAKAIELLQQKAGICHSNRGNEILSKVNSLASTSTTERTQKIVGERMDTTDSRQVQPSSLSESQPWEVLRTHETVMDSMNEDREIETKPGAVLTVEEIKYLTEERIDQLLQQCREEERKIASDRDKNTIRHPYLILGHCITEVFSNFENLAKSFLKAKVKAFCKEEHCRKDFQSKDPMKDTYSFNAPCSATVTGSRHDISSSNAHTSYVSDEETVAPSAQDALDIHRPGVIHKNCSDGINSENRSQEVEVLSPTVDIESVRRVYTKLLGIEEAEKALANSLESLSLDFTLLFNVIRRSRKSSVNLNVFVTVMENPSLHSPEYLETALPRFCKITSELPIEAVAKLAMWWSQYDAERLLKMVQCLQQMLTFKVLQVQMSTDGDEQLDELHSDEVVSSTVKCLRILYYASLLGGRIDKEMDQRIEPGTLPSVIDDLAAAVRLEEGMMGGCEKSVWKDPLSEFLGVTDKDVLDPLIPAEEFQNELLNGTFSIYSDFTNFMIDSGAKSDQFTFMQYPFVLNTVSKTSYFFYDSKIQMLSGRRMMVLQSVLHRSPISPYLQLKIRREHVIADSLVRLEMISNENPHDLRKQLYVEFEDEQGVDEGGVSKEFFQLVIEKIFNPDYGMFTYNEETHVSWFNAHSLENKREFTLIGIVLGLAIYNNCILDVKFPIAVYKKLFGKKARFRDMQQSHPDIHRSLRQLLQYDGNVGNMMVTFSAEYHDMFGMLMKHELKPDGENTPVTKDNRQEFVDLYADWLLNESISEQFNAFREGFDLVVAKSPMKYLFRTSELEVLISGSQEYDFNSLESTAEYDGGFDKDSQTVKDFWSVVHEMVDQDRKKLLQFTTGTDRAPIGGLSHLKLVVARNGPDSDRLPTAHTCFNVILLPDYKNRPKLKERLYKAITHAKGFGML